MTLTVEPGDPRDPAASALLRASHALMESLFPPEDNFFLDIEALTAPHIAFFVARRGGETLGTAALADKGAYGEVKSMFVSEAARGLGVGAALLARIEAEARARNLPALMLETGNLLDAAHRLYARAGFTERGPFGDYPNAASSLFMEKRLG
ncbi:GNAT family N-acetyltransferase [Sinisalibacter lacisalsi]|uniref:N-acetyltransferase n=1 Tax=Sinisalibacter lacisalsi TaxID=1526570 RepID=A0ABQ1QMI3_9RHOB|nr:GNAT family N-acetyltransferase [Sinisalibacter lacisalsi]GGD36632.1 N-acetyltransferase [Sinisalibacter lacisalsi]